MLFSVIVPTCNRMEMLCQCIQRLAPGRQTIDASSFEVIVTDDSKIKNEGSMIITHFPWVKWVCGPQKGPSANRNNGAAYAKGDWLVFLDDDCLPHEDWLENYSRSIAKHPEIKAFEGAILPDDAGLLKRDMAECPVNEKGGCFWSANIAISVDLFRNLGGFNEDFKMASNEDQELYRRLQAHTMVPFLGNVKVTHPVRIVSLMAKLKKLNLSEKSQIQLRKIQEYSKLANWTDGLGIYAHAIVNNLKKGHLKRTTYCLVGLLYRFFYGPLLIHKLYRISN